MLARVREPTLAPTRSTPHYATSRTKASVWAAAAPAVLAQTACLLADFLAKKHHKHHNHHNQKLVGKDMGTTRRPVKVLPLVTVKAPPRTPSPVKTQQLLIMATPKARRVELARGTDLMTAAHRLCCPRLVCPTVVVGVVRLRLRWVLRAV